MSIDTWLFIGFIACLAIMAYVSRRRLVIQRIFGSFIYIAMYRSQAGIGVMKGFAKRFDRLIHLITPVIIGIGFAGMLLVSVEIIAGLYSLIANPAASAGVALVLPIKAKGIFFVPFLYWIISIFLVVLVHEGSHGILAAANRIKIKSSGLAALAIGIPIVPAAFVEPDEKALQKKSARAQLGVFSAGPFANIMLGVCFLILFTNLTNPIVDGFYEKKGVAITKFADGDFPIKTSGLKAGSVITMLDNLPVRDLNDFQLALKSKKPGDSISLTSSEETSEDASKGSSEGTSEKTFSTVLTESKEKPGQPYLGVFVEQSKKLVSTSPWVPFMEWINELFLWVFAMNIGVGLFNLLPLGIVDGGRMLHTALHHFLQEHHANRAWAAVSGFFLFAVVGSIVISFIK